MTESTPQRTPTRVLVVDDEPPIVDLVRGYGVYPLALGEYDEPV